MNKEINILPELRFPQFKNQEKWVLKSLNELGSLVNGLTYSPKDVTNEGLLVLRSSNIQNGVIDYKDCVYVRTDIKGANITKPNDILVCVRNGSKRLIGKNAIIPNDIPYATHGAFMTVFRAEHPEFVFQLFQSDSYNNQVKADLGATINSINGKNFIKYEFGIPLNPKEQEKIASCLSSLDELIAAHNDKLDALNDHKKGLLQNLFPQEGETVPKVRFTEFEGDGEWVHRELGNEISYFKGFAFKSKDYTPNGRRVVRVSDMGFDYVKDEDKAIYINEDDAFQYGKWELVKDDLIITTVGSKPPVYDSLVGRTIVVQEKDSGALLNQNAVCLRAKKIKQKFFNYLFKRNEYINFIESIIRGNANQGSITLENLFKYQLCVPESKDEQQKIASCLSAVDEIINAQQEKIDQLQQHKKGLMQGLFPKIES